MFRTNVVVEMGKSHFEEFFGEDSARAFNEMKKGVKSLYPQVEVGFGTITTIEGLTGIHMTDEYGDVSEDIDRILYNIAKSIPIKDVGRFPRSFCEYSSGEI